MFNSFSVRICQMEGCLRSHWKNLEREIFVWHYSLWTNYTTELLLPKCIQKVRPKIKDVCLLSNPCKTRLCYHLAKNFIA